MSYFTNIAKRGSMSSDVLAGTSTGVLLGSIPGMYSPVLLANTAGSLAGSLSGSGKSRQQRKQDINDMQRNPEAAFIPGVGAYNIASRRRLASQGSSNMPAHQIIGNNTSALLPIGIGAGIGALVGRSKGNIAEGAKVGADTIEVIGKYNKKMTDYTAEGFAGYESYDPPYNEQQLRDHGYSEAIITMLKNDPAHAWRMQTGIELIHREPSKTELMRIWSNWKQMTEEQKKQSDEKCQELFGCTNEVLYNFLLPQYKVDKPAKGIIKYPSKLANYLVPGVAPYHWYKGLGASRNFTDQIMNDNKKSDKNKK